MELKVPFLNTRIENDFLLVFFLTPVWWLTGFNIFAYHAISLWTFFKMLGWITKNNRPLSLSAPLIVFFGFLVSYLVSILINAPVRPAQRIFASLNNYTIVVMGFMIMTTVYHLDGRYFLKNFMKWGSRLCIITSAIGFLILLLWLAGYKDLQLPTLIYRFMPSLINYPYFTMLLMVTGTTADTLSFDVPRLTIYSGVPTSTGGLMLCLIPLMGCYYTLQKRRGPFFWACLAVSLIVLTFTLARAALAGILAAFAVVALLSKGKKASVVMFTFLSVLLSSGAAYRLLEWVLNIRKSSTVGRLNLYREALRIVMDENPLLGVGIRMRDGFTMMAIGSHSLYIEIVFVAGLVGFALFFVFQLMVLMEWFSQRAFLKNHTERTLWEYLGMGLIAMNIWLVTDTIFGPPFTPFGYFLIVSCILLMGKMLRKGGIAEPL